MNVSTGGGGRDKENPGPRWQVQPEGWRAGSVGQLLEAEGAEGFHAELKVELTLPHLYANFFFNMTYYTLEMS